MADVIKIRTNTNAECYLNLDLVTHLRPMGENTAVHYGSEHVVISLPVQQVLGILGWTAFRDCTAPAAAPPQP